MIGQILVVLVVVALISWRAAWVGLQIRRHGGVRAGNFGGTWIVWDDSGLRIVRPSGTTLIKRISTVERNFNTITVRAGGRPYRIRATKAASVAAYIQGITV